MHPTVACTLAAWRAFILSESGARYVARRVLAGSRAKLAEQLRLERWLRARAHYNGCTREDAMGFLYSTCPCCADAASGKNASLVAGRTPVVTTVSAARDLLLQDGMWTEARRAQYRAARRKDESA